MVNLGSRHSVHGFVTLVADGGEVHVSSFFLYLDTLEFGIMEIIGVINIFYFSWIKLFFKCSEVIFTEFSRTFGGKSVLNRVLEPILIFTIDGLSGSLGKTLSIEVFTVNLRDIARVSWNMLSLDITIGTTNPVLTFKRVISILELISDIILWWRLNMIIVLVKLRLGDSYVDIMWRWLVSSFG